MIHATETATIAMHATTFLDLDGNDQGDGRKGSRLGDSSAIKLGDSSAIAVSSLRLWDSEALG